MDPGLGETREVRKVVKRPGLGRDLGCAGALSGYSVNIATGLKISGATQASVRPRVIRDYGVGAPLPTAGIISLPFLQVLQGGGHSVGEVCGNELGHLASQTQVTNVFTSTDASQVPAAAPWLSG